MPSSASAAPLPTSVASRRPVHRSSASLPANMSVGYGVVGLAYKQQLSPRTVSLGLFFDQPYGANIAYPDGTNYYAEGATAELDTNTLTAVLRYEFPNNISVYGGLRYQDHVGRGRPAVCQRRLYRRGRPGRGVGMASWCRLREARHRASRRPDLCLGDPPRARYDRERRRLHSYRHRGRRHPGQHDRDRNAAILDARLPERGRRGHARLRLDPLG